MEPYYPAYSPYDERTPAERKRDEQLANGFAAVVGVAAVAAVCYFAVRALR